MKQRSQRSWILWLALAAIFAPVAGWADTAKLEVLLIYGTNEDKPTEAALSELKEKFKPDFGYKHYSLLGSRKVELKEGESQMVDMGHKLQVSLKHLQARKKFHLMNCDLYHRGDWLLYIQLNVSQEGEPVFIKGPWTEKGLLILAVKAK